MHSRWFISSAVLALVFLVTPPAPAADNPMVMMGNAFKILQLCQDREVCWYAHKDEIDAIIASGVSMNYYNMYGPPWDRCRFTPPGEKCHELTFTFSAKTYILQKESDYVWEYSCEYQTKGGIGILVYEDMNKGFDIWGVASQDMVSFPSCSGQGQGSGTSISMSCGNTSHGPLEVNVTYSRGNDDPPVVDIYGPDAETCTGSYNDPASFTASFTNQPRPDFAPAELDQALVSELNNLIFIKEDVSPEFTRRDEGSLSMSFSMEPNDPTHTPTINQSQ